MAARIDPLRERIHSALTGIGQPAPVSEKAARMAAAMLADAIANDGKHAAQLVHAVLERLRAGRTDGGTLLLHAAAKGIGVVVDHGTGTVRVAMDALSLGPPRGLE
ncbi:MAG: hypothetical protein WD470_00990, partial [Rhodospirillaceae bacterium]